MDNNAKYRVLKVHPADNVIVALTNIEAGERVVLDGREYELLERIPAKHKFSAKHFGPGEEIVMYGVKVGKANREIMTGMRISTENTFHDTEEYSLGATKSKWTPPDTSEFRNTTFMGYHRPDGRVGTRNYWIVIPLVFCENRNVKVIREAMLSQLGYLSERDFAVDIHGLIEEYRKGGSADAILGRDIVKGGSAEPQSRVFPNVDGIRFLTHEGGCGGSWQDIEALCELLAGYVSHPNVAGATVLSLGCQMAQVDALQKAVARRQDGKDKPMFIFEQQKISSEREMISQAVKHTFLGLIEANRLERQPAGLEHLVLGLECGGSDGFSGISANPALGHAADILVQLGGAAILAEFPELNGVEQEIINRCEDPGIARKFMHLMQTYSEKAKEAGSGFENNPSPGNIKDGLITDAMKSAGAAKKGGTSPVRDVLNYTEPLRKKGLNLLCTPGNDVESTTGIAGSGANLIAFTTGLGTPTGNPVAPVLKISSNSALANRMPDLIDFDAGPVITGKKSIEESGTELLRYLVRVASGQELTRAELLGQEDFIPWKRGVSL